MTVRFFNITGGGASSGMSPSIRQVTKMNITAPHETTISIPFNSKFDTLPLEVLKVEGGQKSVTETLCNFNNADAKDFEENEFVEFDGTMNLKIEYGPIDSASYGDDIFILDLGPLIGDKTLKEISVS